MIKLLGENIEAVLFDKDGTIIDFSSIWIPWAKDIYEYLLSTIPNCNLRYEQLMKALGAGEVDEQADPRGPLAIGTMLESQHIVAFKLYEGGMPWNVAVIHAKDSVDYANEKQNHSAFIQAISGIDECLATLKENKLMLGVLTADDTEKAWHHLKKVGLENYFDFVIGSDQVANGKPYPDMALLAKERYGINLSEAMMIGDTNADMQLGKNAGMKMSVGIVSSSSKEAAHLEDADRIIYHYQQLFK